MKSSIKTVPLLENGLYPPICSSLSQGWKHILIEEFRQSPGQEKYENSAEHTVCVSLNHRPSRLLQVMGDRQHTSPCISGDICIVPAGIPFFWQWENEDQYLRIRLAAKFVQQVAAAAIGVDANQLELRPEFRTRNLQLEQISTLLLAELKNGGLAGQLYIESLANVLAVQLLREQVTVQPCRVLYEGGLSDRQLRRVIDYINENLAQDIQLSDLSQLLEMSQFHFSRLFKQSMAMTPHRYLIQQRLERAKQLLKATELSVMEIAMRCGFSSHSHLDKLFRQHLGVTPKTYRAG